MLDACIENALDRVTERLRSAEGSKKSLKKHLLQVFISSLYYNPAATLNYMKTRNILKDILVEIFKVKTEFKEPFE